MEDERGEPLNHQSAEWSVGTLAIYNEALRKADERFEAERDRRITELRKQSEKALKLQHSEYERRLSALNHAHDQAREVQRTYVTDEKFGDFVKRYEENREIVAKALTLAEGKTTGSLDARYVIFAVIGFIFAFGTILAQAHVFG